MLECRADFFDVDRAFIGVVLIASSGLLSAYVNDVFGLALTYPYGENSSLSKDMAGLLFLSQG